MPSRPPVSLVGCNPTVGRPEPNSSEINVEEEQKDVIDSSEINVKNVTKRGIPA